MTVTTTPTHIELELDPATHAAWKRQCERIGAPLTGETLLKAALHHAERIQNDPAYAAELRAKNEARRAKRVDVELELETDLLREAEAHAEANGVTIDQWIEDAVTARRAS